MNFLGLHLIDWLVLLLFFALMLAIGLRARRRVKTTGDFYQGSRSFGKWLTAFLNFGNMTDAGQAAGVTREIYRQGLQGVWFQNLVLFHTPFQWFIAALQRRARYLGPADLFLHRFESRFLAGLYALVLVCGAAYLLFIPVFLAVAVWWRFRAKLPGADRVMWALLGLNLTGYAVYLLYPAAPPWYVDRHGLGPAVLTALPEAAGAARFDALLGVNWFAGYYGRNANVFGAIPSLHVGQTFLAVLYAWQFRSLRGFTTGFWLLVCFASVYLNHHYVIDGLAGMALALGVWAAIEGWARRGPAALRRG